MIYPRYNFVESEIYTLYAKDRPEIHIKYTWDIHSLVCVWFSFRKFLHILQAGTCQRILDGAKCGKNCCVFQGYLNTARVDCLQTYFNFSWVRIFYHIGNCKQINIPCRGKKFLWGEQVQGVGLVVGYNFCSSVPPPLSTPQLETLSIVMCPFPSIRNSGF